MNAIPEITEAEKPQLVDYRKTFLFSVWRECPVDDVSQDAHFRNKLGEVKTNEYLQWLSTVPLETREQVSRVVQILLHPEKRELHQIHRLKDKWNQFEALLTEALSSSSLESGNSVEMIRRIEMFAKLVEQHTEAWTERCPWLYTAWKNSNFDLGIYQSLGQYLKILESFFSYSLSPLFKSQMMNLAKTNRDDIVVYLNRMICFAQYAAQGKLDIFESLEKFHLSSALSRFDMASPDRYFDMASLDQYIEIAQYLNQVNEKRANRDLINTCISYFDHTVEKLDRVRTGLRVMQSSNLAQQHPPYRHLLLDIYLSNERLSSADLKMAIQVSIQVWDPFFERFKESFFDAFRNNRQCEGVPQINRYHELFTELPILRGDRNPKYCLEHFEQAYIKKASIKSVSELSIVVAVYRRLRSAPIIADIYLDAMQRYTPQFKSCIEILHQHPSLPPEAVSRLFYCFHQKPPAALKVAIEVMELAIQLSQDEALFHDHFSTLDHQAKGRILIMSYVHHGLLDFLGRCFLDKCVSKYRALMRISSQRPPCSDREQWATGLQDAYQHVPQIMHELLEVMRIPVEHTSAPQQVCQFEVPIAAHRVSFQQQRQHYATFWLTNRLRKRQAQLFFENLNGVDAHVYQSQVYYMGVLRVIFQTQQRIIREDKQVTRRFTHLNRKGYSRLYDITHEILSDMLQSYHDAAASGRISPTEHQCFYSALERQCDFLMNALMDTLPSTHPLKRQLRPYCSSNGVNWFQENEIAIRDIFKQEHPIPEHLQHLLESARHYLILTEMRLQQDAEIAPVREQHPSRSFNDKLSSFSYNLAFAPYIISHGVFSSYFKGSRMRAHPNISEDYAKDLGDGDAGTLCVYLSPILLPLTLVTLGLAGAIYFIASLAKLMVDSVADRFSPRSPVFGS